ncbi:MAG: [FeFe] hydrogenase H-cluster maturation GTPase HydF, partial [Lentisphaeria bacterium]|nr:[FeFe] hydrogenase H-cluster maturation GTPase HydF [Lentisphaeria bacterium]
TSVFMQGCKAIDSLQDGDRVLIAEACTHHPTCEDIGRVKIPMLLQKKTGKKLQFDFAPGRDFPENITQYKLIVHCGSCMLNRHETLDRVYRAQSAGIPIANYGMTISYCQGVLDKVLIPE